MSSTIQPIDESGSRPHTSVFYETGATIAAPRAVAQALSNGGAVVSIALDGPGSVGMTAGGALTYRPAADFLGEERVTLRVADAAGVERTVEVEIEVKPGAAAGGWSEGEHYLLARDANGWSVTEPGQNHRMVYVSPDGRPGADGLTPGTAITPNALKDVLNTLKLDANRGDSPYEPASWHVLFERDHDYGAFTPPIVSGEDALHPFVVGAYGVGDRPLFSADIRMNGTGEGAISNYVVRDLAFGYASEAAAEAAGVSSKGLSIVGAGHENLLFENLQIKATGGTPAVVSESTGLTFYRLTTVDAHLTDPDRRDDWLDPIRDRTSGLYLSRADKVLVLESAAVHNGWQDGYDPTGAYSDSQPPSAYSHNFYIARNVDDLTFADNLSVDGASFGAQLRPSGAIYGNVFWGNNAGLNMLGGGLLDDGTFSNAMGLLLDTVVTAPGLKTAYQAGALGWGTSLAGPGFAADLIVAQDGDAPGSSPSGVTKGFGDSPKDGYVYDAEGVTVFNWGKEIEQTQQGADRATMIATTIDSFAASLGLDRDGLSDALRARDRGDWGDAPTAADVLEYFRSGFGYEALAAAAGRTVTFEGEARAEGFRWDNRLNWSDDLAPKSGDIVRLDGHAVTYGLDTLALRKLDFGQGGALRVTQALVAVDALSADRLGGSVLTSGAGQFLFDGYADQDALRLVADGGRIANTGVATGRIEAELRAGQFLLGDGDALFRLDADDALTVTGSLGRIGFDGAGGDATLRLAGGVLRFEADASGVSTIGEFASGRHGAAAPGVRSILDLRGGVIEVDLSKYNPANGLSMTLVDTDVILGDLAAIQLQLIGVPTGYQARIGVNEEASALGVTLAAGALPEQPLAPRIVNAPAPAPGPALDLGFNTNWMPADSYDATPEIEIVFAPLAVNWSATAAPQLSQFTGSRTNADWSLSANWANGRAPVTGDWVQLQGRSALVDGGVFGATALNFGDGGELHVTGGLVEAQRVVSQGGQVMLVDDGQFVFNGLGDTHTLSLDVAGGRAVNAGLVKGELDITVSSGEMLLAEAGGEMRVVDGATLTVRGDDARIGFDGAAGQANLLLDGGTLRFEADATGVSTIGEFASGRYGAAAPGVWSVLNLKAGVIEVNLSAYNPANGLDLTLIDVDELVGNPAEIDFRIIGAPSGYGVRFGTNGALDVVGVTLIAGATGDATGGGTDGGTDGGAATGQTAFAPLAVNWSAAAAPQLSQFTGSRTNADWSLSANWANGRAPVTGDWVQLQGHSALFDDGLFGATALNFGDGGALRVEGGLVEALQVVSKSGEVMLVDDGQFVFNGLGDTHTLSLDVAGGRAVNAGLVKGELDITVSSGEMLLAEAGGEMRVVDGATLTVRGDDARIGFDGAAGQAKLLLDGGTLRFEADATGVSTIGEFASGRYGATPGVDSRMALQGGLIEVDLSAYDTANGLELTLVDVDQLDRNFYSFFHLETRVTGLRAGLDASVVIDETAGLISVDLTESLIF